MRGASNYWQLIRIDAAGQRRVEERAIARTLLEKRFISLLDMDNVDNTLQPLLLRVLNDPQEELGDREAAALCLRCYASHVIEFVCIQLERQFGSHHGFTRWELLPLLLDDDGRQPFFANGVSGAHPPTARSFVLDVLQSFKDGRSTLNGWITRLVRSHRELTLFLRERGVYLASDWALLNQVSPGQLRRILTEFHGVSEETVGQACALLQSYHAVYLRDRQKQHQQGQIAGKARCMPPTTDQLNRMVEGMRELSAITLSHPALLSRLQAIATCIRQYRLSTLPTSSLDQAEGTIDVPCPPQDDTEEEREQFLDFYRRQFMECLDQALETVTTHRMTHLQRKHPQKAQLFLEALRLFHCQGKAMGEIACELGMRAQDAVSRLLKLKTFRASVGQTLLMLLCESVLDKAQFYTSPDQLRDLEKTIKAALEEQIETMLQEVQLESTVARNQPLNSVFARRLCHYLDA